MLGCSLSVASSVEYVCCWQTSRLARSQFTAGSFSRVALKQTDQQTCLIPVRRLLSWQSIFVAGRQADLLAQFTGSFFSGVDFLERSLLVVKLKALLGGLLLEADFFLLAEDSCRRTSSLLAEDQLLLPTEQS